MMKWQSNKSHQGMAGILLEVNQQLQSSLDKGIAVSQQEKGSVVQQESRCQGGQQSIIMRAFFVNPLPLQKPTITTIKQ